MASTMSNGVSDLAREIAQDQIEQDIETNTKISQLNNLISENAQGISDLKQQIIEVCNSVAAGESTYQSNSIGVKNG